MKKIGEFLRRGYGFSYLAIDFATAQHKLASIPYYAYIAFGLANLCVCVNRIFEADSVW